MKNQQQNKTKQSRKTHKNQQKQQIPIKTITNLRHKVRLKNNNGRPTKGRKPQNYAITIELKQTNDNCYATECCCMYITL